MLVVEVGNEGTEGVLVVVWSWAVLVMVAVIMAQVAPIVVAEVMA